MKITNIKITLTLFITLLLFACMSYSEHTDPGRWESQIQKFETDDKTNFPPQGATLFIGSSSIVYWKSLKEDFYPHPVINRGFGGATTTDLVTYVDRIVLPYKPGKIVVYCGGNDIAGGSSTNTPAQDMFTFVNRIREALPNTKIYILSIKPSPRRMDKWKAFQKVNVARKSFADKTENVFYIDITKTMFNNDGSIKENIFRPDRVHMNASGYALWVKVLREKLGLNS